MFIEFSLSMLMAGTPTPIRSFLLCDMCETKENVQDFLAREAPVVNGYYFDLIGNPKTGAMYSVEYDVVSGAKDRVVINRFERQSVETERQFMDIINAAKASQGMGNSKR